MNRLVALILLAALPALAGCTSTKSIKRVASAAADVASLARPDLAGKIDVAKKAVMVEESDNGAITEAQAIAALLSYGYTPAVVYRHKGAVVESTDLSKSIVLDKTRTGDSGDFSIDSTPELESASKASGDLTNSKKLLGKIFEESGAAK